MLKILILFLFALVNFNIASADIFIGNPFDQITWTADSDGSSFSAMPSMTKVNLWTPSSANDYSNNHHVRTAVLSGVCYAMFSTHNNDEEDRGMFTRYSYSTACDGTWVTPITLLSSMDTMDTTPNSRLDGRVNQPAIWITVGGVLYAIIDVYDENWGTTFDPREPIGLIAVSVNQATLGTPCWVEPDSQPTPIGGYPSYSLCAEPLKTNIKDAMYAPTEALAWGFGIPPGDYDDTITGCGDTLLERAGWQNPDGTYSRMWRCDNSGSPNQLYVYIQNSYDGENWLEAFRSGIPNSPSAVQFKKISTNHYAIMGNPNDGGGRDPQYFSHSGTSLIFKDSNSYKVCDGESATPVYSGSSKSGGCSYVDFSCVTESGGLCTKIISGYSKQKEKVEVAIFNLPALN